MAKAATIYSVSGDDDGFFFGGTCSVTWSFDDSLYYKVKLSLGGWSQLSGIKHPDSATYKEGSYTYRTTVSMDALYYVTSTTSAQLSVELFTYSDSGCTKLVGKVEDVPKEVIIVHLKKTDAIPQMLSAGISRNNSDTVISVLDASIAGYTRAQITMGARGIYGSAIASFSVSGDISAYIPSSMISYSESDGVYSATFISSVIKSGGTKKIRVTCTDSRGHTSELSSDSSNAYKEGYMTVQDYVYPEITSLNASRNASNQIVVNATWAVSDITDDYGSHVNSTAADTQYIVYKQSTATDWSLYGTISNGSSLTLSSLSILDNVSYNIRLVVSDRLGNQAYKDTFVSTSSVILDFMAGGYGFGVGKICEREGMEVSMETTFFGPVNIGSRQQRLEDYIHSVVNELSVRDIVDIVYPVGSIYITTVFPENSTPAAIFGGSWVQIKDRFILSAGDKYTGMSVGGESEHTLSLREMPMHRHYGSPRAYYDRDHNPGTHPPAVQMTDQNYYDTNLFSNYTGGTEHGVPGSCAAHNNMPPYIAVFVWQRVA